MLDVKTAHSQQQMDQSEQEKMERTVTVWFVLKEWKCSLKVFATWCERQKVDVENWWMFSQRLKLFIGLPLMCSVEWALRKQHQAIHWHHLNRVRPAARFAIECHANDD